MILKFAREYSPKTYSIDSPLSTEQIEEHMDLYHGYCKNYSELKSQLHSGSLDAATRDMLTTRLAFEQNGLKLHELYFENIDSPQPNKKFEARILAERKLSFKKYLEVLKQVAQTRGPGWLVVYLDEVSGTIQETFVSLHSLGLLQGKILLALDLWEHAYMRDFKATERDEYFSLILKNVDWNVVYERIGN